MGIFRHLCESAEMALDRVRMGIVGTGNIATLNVPGYLEHEQCDVVAVCDPRPDVLERRMLEWGVERGYTDMDQLLADDRWEKTGVGKGWRSRWSADD